MRQISNCTVLMFIVQNFKKWNVSSYINIKDKHFHHRITYK